MDVDRPPFGAVPGGGSFLHVALPNVNSLHIRSGNRDNSVWMSSLKKLSVASPHLSFMILPIQSRSLRYEQQASPNLLSHLDDVTSSKATWRSRMHGFCSFATVLRHGACLRYCFLRSDPGVQYSLRSLCAPWNREPVNDRWSLVKQFLVKLWTQVSASLMKVHCLSKSFSVVPTADCPCVETRREAAQRSSSRRWHFCAWIRETPKRRRIKVKNKSFIVVKW